MKSSTYVSGILILALLLIVILACDDTPIFYTLEKAYRTSDDRGLEDNIFVEKIVYAGAAGRYFINAQSVYQRDEGASGTWQRVTPPASGALCGALEYFSVTGEIIAWYYNSEDLEPVGLYKRDPSTSPSDSWTEITDSDWTGSGFRIGFLKEEGGTLFVSTALYDSGSQTTTYNVEYTTAPPLIGTDEFDPCFLTDLNSEILDVEYYGTDYWLITTPETGTPPTFLYQGGTPTTFVEDGGRPDFSYNGEDPTGTIYAPNSLCVAAGNLYLSGWHGRIFVYDGAWSGWDGDPPDNPPKTVTVGNRDYTVQFTNFAETGKNDEMFVGSTEYGYFSFSALTAPDSAGDLTRQPAQPLYEYPPTELVNGAIQNFLAPANAENADTMFACTAGAGLWRGDWDGTKWVWRQE